MTGADKQSNPPAQTMIHATCVAVQGRAVLIRGASGTGKSALALQLMAMGASLVADDRTSLARDGAALIADAPDTIRGRIEAREVGILTAPAAGPAPVHLIVNMDSAETNRLPEPQEDRILGVAVPVFRKSTLAHFPAAILLYLLHHD